MLMKKVLLPVLLVVALPFAGRTQCTTTNATSCVCETPGSTNCDLLPDIIVARPPLLVSGNSGIIEYSQSGNGANDGRLRLSVSTPNVGHGPLEVRTTNKYICGTDTITGTAPATCPNTGLPPKQLVVQRVYHKNNSAMTFTDRHAGSMTYHPSHGHMHVDDWGVYTLRTQTNDPNPLNWPIIGTGAKLAFCLMDYGSCSTYNGHCVDDNGNTLLNGNFPNYGLGGGNYNCSPVVQGISSGYTDIYYQSLDGMWIDIPPGTCNGTYYIVVQLDPYDYFLEEDETNNILTVPYTLTQQVSNSTASITSAATGPFCLGSTVTLNANTGAGYTYLWSNGATTPSINVTTAGNYVVTVSSTCGTTASAPFPVSFVGSTPVTAGASVCGQGSSTLQATANGATINWYAASSGGSSLGTGTGFVTPVLNNTTTYYAEATTTSPGFTGNAQPSTNGIGSGGFFTGSQYMIFDALQNFTLKSVKVYAQSGTSTTVELRNASGSLLNSATVSVPSGESRITLNWPVTAGNDLRLTRSGSASLYRNNTGAAYPYTIPGYLSIKNSSAGTSFYYFFYDWEIQTPTLNCVSARVPATLTVNSNPTVTLANFNNICNNASPLSLSGGSPAGGTYSGTGITNNIFNPATAGTGTHAITYSYTDANGCSASALKNIVVDDCSCTVPLPPTMIQGTAKPCPGTTIAYSTPNVAGVTSWNWTLPTGVSFVSGQGTRNVSLHFAPTFVSGNVCVTAVNACGSSTQKCKLMKKSVAIKPAAIIGEVNSTCDRIVTLSVDPVAGATLYNWSLPAGCSVVSGAGTNTIQFTTNAGFTGGQVCVSSYNGCVTSNTRCKTIFSTPLQTPISGPVSVCAGQQVTYSVAPVFGATIYRWTVPAGTIINSGQNSTTIVVTIGSNGGQITCRAKNDCGSRGTSKLNFNISCREAFIQDEFKIFPNPASDKIEIEFSSETNGSAQLLLTDITGRTVASETFKVNDGYNSQVMDLKDFSPGSYMLSIIQGESIIRKKIIIEK